MVIGERKNEQLQRAKESEEMIVKQPTSLVSLLQLSKYRRHSVFLQTHRHICIHAPLFQVLLTVSTLTMLKKTKTESFLFQMFPSYIFLSPFSLLVFILKELCKFA